MGHLKTLWTVFSVPHPLVDKHGHFGNPPLYPCRFSNDTPSALFQEKISMYDFSGILKSQQTTRYLWNI